MPKIFPWSGAKLSQNSSDIQPLNHGVIEKVDRLVLQNLLKPPKLMRQRSSSESLDHEQRVYALNKFSKIYGKDTFGGNPDLFYQSPEEIRPMIESEGTYLPGVQVSLMSWQSQFKPLWNDSYLDPTLLGMGVDRRQTFTEKFESHKENKICWVRWFKHTQGAPRKTIVLLHGYGGGHLPLEERAWPTRKTLARGYDVVMMVLPFHGRRKKKSRVILPPRFPSADLRFTVEGIRQTVFDFNCLLKYLHRRGIQDISLAGMSLGGYCSSIIASIQSDLSVTIPVIPLGCMIDLIEKQERLVGDPEEKAMQKKAIEASFSMVNPTTFSPKTRPQNIRIIAGKEDGITGVAHAEILQKHFDCNIDWFSGGHIFRKGFSHLWNEVLARPY